MMFIDPHTHMISRTTDDYESMAAAGVVACIEPAFWLGQPRTNVGSYIDYLSTIVELSIVPTVLGTEAQQDEFESLLRVVAIGRACGMPVIAADTPPGTSSPPACETCSAIGARSAAAQLAQAVDAMEDMTDRVGYSTTRKPVRALAL